MTAKKASYTTIIDKVVVIAGGAGLLGRSFAECIVRNGGKAIIADIDAKPATKHAEQLCAEGPGSAEFCHLDITDTASIASALERLLARYGRIDALINSAYPRNAAYGSKLEKVTYESFCDNVGSHLGGYFLTAQQFALYFRAQGYGNIVNIGSVYGSMVPRFQIYDGTDMTMPVEYAAIKSAVIHLTRYFAQYFKRDRIRVNCISPGGIFDDQSESFVARYRAFCMSSGMMDAADVGGALLFLLSDASSMITGQNIVIDDGFSL